MTHRDSLTDEELTVLSQVADEPRARAEAPTASQPDAADCTPLEELHQQLAPQLGDTLVRMGLTHARCRLREAMRGTYGQFVFGQTVPTCCAVVRPEPLSGECFVAVQPTILYPLMDAQWGVTAHEPPPERPLSELETTVAIAVLRPLLETYAQGFQRGLTLELHVDRLEHNPQRLRGLAGGQRVYLVTYDVQCQADYGRLTFCWPWPLLEQCVQPSAPTSGSTSPSATD